MVTYQVVYRSYLKKYEDSPPPWSYAPLQSVSRSMAEAKNLLHIHLEKIKAKSLSWREPPWSKSVIVEVKIEASDGQTYDYRKITLPGRIAW